MNRKTTLLAFLGVLPPLSAISCSTPPALAATQDDGRALLKSWHDKLAQTKTMSGSVVVSPANGKPHTEYKFRFMKPNLLAVSSSDYERYCDGNNQWIYMPTAKQFIKQQPVISIYLPLGLEGFFHASSVTLDYEKHEQANFEAQNAIAVYVKIKGDTIPDSVKKNTYIYYFAEDGTLLGYLQNPGTAFELKGVYKNIKFDETMTVESFKWTPPADATEYKPRENQQPDFEATLLKVGEVAPDFELKTNYGTTIRLSEFVKGKKVTIVNFWFYNCGACREEFPHLEELYVKYKDKGLNVLAVNYGDSAETITAYYKKGGFTFPSVMNAKNNEVPQKYGVVAYPTNYLLDENKKVLARFVGFNKPLIEDVLAKNGIK